MLIVFHLYAKLYRATCSKLRSRVQQSIGWFMLRVCRCWSKPKTQRTRHHQLKMYPWDILNPREFFEIHNWKNRLSLCNVSFFMNNTHVMISALQLFWPNNFISMTIFHFSLHLYFCCFHWPKVMEMPFFLNDMSYDLAKVPKLHLVVSR